MICQLLTETSTKIPGVSGNKPVIMLVNDSHICVKISLYGATVTEVQLPDKIGNFKNIALSLSSPSEYVGGSSYAGATLGPNAGRIRGGELCIGDETYSLSRNDRGSQLHGGIENFSYAVWTVLQTEAGGDKAFVTLGLDAADGLDGYPGNRRISVTYTLDNSNSLTISYRAETDKPTWMNLSNHTYWNLSGDFSKSAADLALQINADSVIYNDTLDLPLDFHAVGNTPFDFRTPRAIREQLAAYPDEGQIAMSRGYNNAYVLRDRTSDGSVPAAVLTDRESGRRVSVFTDYPSLVFYSGGYLDKNITLAGGIPCTPSCAVALEAQEFPDALHLPDVPHPILYPGKLLQRTIRFAFDTVDA